MPQSNEPYQINVVHVLLGVCSYFGFLQLRQERKNLIINFTKKKNVQAFVNFPIRPNILFCRQHFFQEVFVRLYFLVKITLGKVNIDFTGGKGFHILLWHSVSVIRPHVIHDG